MRAQCTPIARTRTRIGHSVLPLLWAVGVCATLVAQTPASPGQPPQPPASVPAGGAPADPKPPEGQPPAETKTVTPTLATNLKFTTPAGMLLAAIKPDKAADYEALLASFVDALKKSDDPLQKQMAEGLRVYKATEPAPGGTNTLYLLLLDPVVPEANYSWQALMERVYAAAPDQAKVIFEKATTVHGGPMNKLSLTPVSLTPVPAPAEGAAPAAPAAVPAAPAAPKKPGN